MLHELKCHPQYFERLVDGSKTFEVRRDDRGYQAGDVLRIREWVPPSARATATYTAREREFQVGYVLRTDPALGLDLREFVVMSLLPLAVTNPGGTDVRD